MSNQKNSSFQSAFMKAVEVMNPVATKRMQIQCETCERIFTQTSHFESHLCNQKPREVACEICHKMFYSKCRLKQHLRVHYGEKPFECHICKKTFPHKNYMTEHLLTHTEDKSFKCNICDKSYIKAETLKEHIYTHTGKRTYKCEHCNKEFGVLSNLRAHLTTHQSTKTYECEFCPYVCSTRYNLKDHLLATHEEAKPFKCDTCGKRFALKSTLKRHSMTHLGEKPFGCDQCDKAFTRKDYLSAHVEYVHKNDSRIFEKCHICNKRFMFKSRFQKHMKIHSRLGCLFCAKPTEECVCSKTPGDDRRDPLRDPRAKDDFMFKCQTCSKIVLRKSQLNTHLRIHRDYECIICKEDYRKCRCTDDHMEVSKSKNTYKKNNKSFTNAEEQQVAEGTDEPGVEVKEEDTVIRDNELVVKSENKLIEQSEIVIPKEEPKDEYFDIDENSVEPFVYLTAEVDVDIGNEISNVKEESIEF